MERENTVPSGKATSSRPLHHVLLRLHRQPTAVHRGGVAVIVTRKAEKTLLEWKPINDRLMKVRFNSKFAKLTIIACYAPTEDAEEEERRLLRTLGEEIWTTSWHDVLMVGTYLCSLVPMFPGFCTLIVVISINRLQILPTPWYDCRLGLCLGFRFRVLVRVRVMVRLEIQTVFRLWLGCGLGLSLYG